MVGCEPLGQLPDGQGSPQCVTVREVVLRAFEYLDAAVRLQQHLPESKRQGGGLLSPT